MSFLTPLYLLGALAVGLPVLFHMIRRTPRGRRDFSSVMFLEPSPPRITRRSRIEHWLLLFLRALAVCLLAFAFARPFLRVSEGQALMEGDTRDFVILVDTSASMRRDGVWSEAVSRIESLLDEMQPLDRVSLVSYDVRPRVLVDFSQWTALEPGQRVAAAKAALKDVSPTWGATNLGRALMEAAERLDAEATHDEVPRLRSIVLVSDLQEGGRLEDLQAYQWPPQVNVRLETVGNDVSPNNAGLQPFSDSQNSDANDVRVRARVTNASDSRREQLVVRWGDEFETRTSPQVERTADRAEEKTADAVTVIVPPGQSRIVSAPPRPSRGSANELVLEGDDHEFDNHCYLPVPRQRTVNVAVLSDRAADDEQGMWYYVQRALVSTLDRTVEIRPLDDVVPLNAADGASAAELVIITAVPPVDRASELRAYVEAGGTVLLVPTNAADFATLYDLVGIAPGEVREANVETYSMLINLDFTHPLFAALDHPRYSDFTKVRFWKHRSIDPASLPDGRILARFDNGDVSIGEIQFGNGRVVFLTSGWHPEDSQLALSSKFVPMLNGLLDAAAGIIDRRDHYVVGDSVDLAAFVSAGGRITGVQTPDGERITVDAESPSFTETDRPGIYRVEITNGPENAPVEFVVNLDPAESRTSRLPRQQLEAANINLAAAEPEAGVMIDGERQLHGSELENEQKLWRWLVIAAIVVLLVETWLAGRTSRAQVVGS